MYLHAGIPQSTYCNSGNKLPANNCVQWVNCLVYSQTCVHVISSSDNSQCNLWLVFLEIGT